MTQWMKFTNCKQHLINETEPQPRPSRFCKKIARLFFMTQDIERDLPSSIGVLCLQISSEDRQWLNEFQQQFLL